MHGNRKNTNLAKTLKILIFLREIDIFKVSSNNFFKKIVQKLSKFACFLGPRFWKGFGRVLGGFWEAKILDFRTFFAVFSMQNFECNLEGQKKRKKRKKHPRERQNLSSDGTESA